MKLDNLSFDIWLQTLHRISEICYLHVCRMMHADADSAVHVAYRMLRYF